MDKKSGSESKKSEMNEFLSIDEFKDEIKKVGRPYKVAYSFKESISYVSKYLNETLNLEKHIKPSRDQILKYTVSHGIISSSMSAQNIAAFSIKNLCRLIFANLSEHSKGNNPAAPILKTTLDEKMKRLEKNGPRSFDMKMTFDSFKIPYKEEESEEKNIIAEKKKLPTEEEEEEEEEEDQENYEKEEEAEKKDKSILYVKDRSLLDAKDRSLLSVKDDFEAVQARYKYAEMNRTITSWQEYLQYFKTFYNYFKRLPISDQRRVMSVENEQQFVFQYGVIKRTVERYHNQNNNKKQDDVLNRASVLYGDQSQQDQSQQDQLPRFKLSLPAINVADAKSNEVRAELEAEKKAAEDINKQIDMFTIQNIGSNKIENYNNALISAGMTSEEDRKKAIRRVFFSAIKSKLNTELSTMIKLYKLEGTTIEKDVNNMLEARTQPSMIEEFDPLSFLNKTRQYISSVTESMPVATGVEEGKILDIEEKEVINKPIEKFKNDLKEENNVMQLNKRIIKAKIEEAIKFHDGSLEPVLNPSIRRINNLPDNVIPVISKPDIHGDERRVLCNYGTSYN